jgi:Polysaccharide lyase
MALARRRRSGAGSPASPSTARRRTGGFRSKFRLGAALLALAALCAPATAAVRHARGSSTGLLFNGTNKSAWPVDQSATTARIRKVSNPIGSGTALRFQTYNGDVFPLTPTTNPRAQLLAPLSNSPGVQFWESYEVYVPTNFPLAATHHGWISLGSPAFGPPWAGTPSVELAIVDGDFRFQRNGYAADPWQIAWQTPVVEGRWVRFTWHVLLSRAGYVQLYMNNAPLELADGSATSTTLYMPVIDQSNYEGPWISQLAVYYKHNMAPKVTLYFRDFQIAKTEALAAGS